MEPSNPGTKLAVVGSRAEALALVSQRGVIHGLTEMLDFFEAIRPHAVVLAPVAHLGALPPLHRIQISAVTADPTPNNGDVYVADFCKSGQGAPTKAFLLKIMAAAGIGLGDTRVTAKDNVFSATVLLIGKGLDGQQRRVMASKTIDLTDDAPGAFDGKGQRLTKSALGRARTHAPQMAESKAILRGIRAWFGMKQAYSLEDFKKPWVIPALILHLDEKNPEHLKYIVGMSVGATDQLFGAAPGAAVALLPAAAAGDVHDAELSGGGKIEEAPPDDDDDHDDDEEVDIPAADPPPPAEPAEDAARHACACACGHQAELSAAFAQRTIEVLGVKLCPRCVPSKSFDEASHASLKALNFPKRSEWNVVAAAIKKAREERAKAAPAK